MDPNSLLGLLASGLAVCHAATVDHGGVLGGLFLTGLIGSLTHCAGMCGPFVLSQVAARLERVPARAMREWHRLSGGALVPYHLGRITAYVLLGAAAAGAVGGAVGRSTLFRPLAAGLLLLAALFLLGLAIPRIKALLNGGGTGGASDWWGRTLGRWARPLFAAPSGGRGYLLGMALGFIPCGLVYAALAGAAATGDAVAGALGMLAFAAGTIPLLVAVGMAGQAAVGRWRQPIFKWAPLLLVANAGMLGLMAVELLG